MEKGRHRQKKNIDVKGTKKEDIKRKKRTSPKKRKKKEEDHRQERERERKKGNLGWMSINTHRSVIRKMEQIKTETRLDRKRQTTEGKNQNSWQKKGGEEERGRVVGKEEEVDERGKINQGKKN